MTEQFDVVIIGSGVGGGTVAHTLAHSQARILVVERGDFVPQEPGNWDPQVVWRQKKYRATEMWLDEFGRDFSPYTHYCVGGNSKFWGTVLYRFRREDFGEVRHLEGVSPAWPIDYDTLAPYYERAEHLYSVHGQKGIDPTEPPRGEFPHPPVAHQGRMAQIVERLKAIGLNPAYLPLGVINPGKENGCILCNTCNSFPCQLRVKSDADVCALTPALSHPNVTLWRNTFANRLLTNARGDKVVAAELVRDGETVRVEAPLFVVSCGAVNSAALLLRSATKERPEGVANSSGLVGRRYMAHHATMLAGFFPPRNDTVFGKTVAINDFYFTGSKDGFPLGNIQSQGRAHTEQAKYGGPAIARRIPRALFDMWFSCGVEWLAMSEDLPEPDNRVTLAPGGRIRLTYKPGNMKVHHELVRLTRQLLGKVGFWYVHPVSLGRVNTTHQCGTAVFGADPRISVLDPFCRSHDADNLFVVDASFFPSSAAVNPGLTVAAQALRSADHIMETHLK